MNNCMSSMDSNNPNHSQRQQIILWQGIKTLNVNQIRRYNLNLCENNIEISLKKSFSKIQH